ncbi:CHAD domain-containing protein [Nocardia sp. NBC_01329]|uniref:CHAD domain-containing protein n=1 Tax=Nocardia sp. NBC_01329 TaxID=2903594 RepID=UPI002E0DE255|nr:CHAD domain-containing protein [Nocardia sp. NBC_01329]
MGDKPIESGPALTEALRADIERLLTAEPDVRADADDSVHQMRVATRRLRSVLRSYKALLESDADNRIRTELAWLAGILGVARDAEVRAERFAALLDRYAAPDSAALESTRDRLVRAERDRYAAAHGEVLTALDSDRYRAMRRELKKWRKAPPLRDSVAGTPAGEMFETVLRKDRKRVRRLVRSEPTVAPVERVELLHDIRKSAKRLRYSCEAATAVLGDPAADLGKRAKHLQTVLGDHRDAVESYDALRIRAAEAHTVGEDTALFETLADAEDTAAGRCLAQYPAAAAAIDTA